MMEKFDGDAREIAHAALCATTGVKAGSTAYLVASHLISEAKASKEVKAAAFRMFKAARSERRC